MNKINTQIFEQKVTLDEFEQAKDTANKIANVEKHNLDADKDATQTDWTAEQEQKKTMLKEADVIEFDITHVEKATCENHENVAKNLLELK